MKKLFHVSIFLILLLTSLSLVLVMNTGQLQADSKTPTVFILGIDEYHELAKDVLMERAIDYGSFVWAEVSANNSQAISLANSQVVDDPFTVYIGEYHFDPLISEPNIPSSLKSPERENGEIQPQLFLLQLHGPTKDEWLTELREVGIEPIQFYAELSYLVWATPNDLQSALALPFVRWVGDYHPAYKLQPALLQAQGPTNMKALVYDDGNLDDVRRMIQDLGAQVDYLSPSANASGVIEFSLDATQAIQVAQLPSIIAMQVMNEIELDDEISSMIVAGDYQGTTPNAPNYQNWLSNEVGVDGSGVIIQIVDSGIDQNHVDLAGRQVAEINGTQSSSHGTHVAGILLGNATSVITDTSGYLYGLGIAPGATYIDHKNNDTIPNFLSLAIANNATLSQNSWGYTDSAGSGYTTNARDYDAGVRDADLNMNGLQPLILVFSAGNSGAAGLTEPKEAKNIISVANYYNFRTSTGIPGNDTGVDIDTRDARNNGSSQGPCLDGRVCPTIAAPGGNIVSSRFPDTDPNSCGFWTPQNSTIHSICSGTSMAAPQVSGALALLTEWWNGYPNLDAFSPALAKAVLVNHAVDMGTADIPNGNEGWGRINLDNIMAGSRNYYFFNQRTTLNATGDTWTYQVMAEDPDEPLKISIVWTDAPGPGNGGSTVALVNDLNLTVTTGNTTYRGNAFTNGWSDSSLTSADDRNNVENIYIQDPGDGVYNVTVTAANISGDGVPGNADLTDQDFAFVVSNVQVVQSPTDENNPVYAGPANNPTKTIIRTTRLVSGLTKDDFTVQIGGSDANVVTVYEGSDEYVLEIVPPIQTSNGQYDLTVAAEGNSALIIGTKPQAVLYADTNNVDVSLVIDRSGSMEYGFYGPYEYMQPAKDAATLFTNLMQDDDQLAVVSFNSFVDVPHSMAPLHPASRAAAILAIDNLTASGSTSIGGGLEEGQNQLLNNGEATHPWAIVLLTDGQEMVNPGFEDTLIPEIAATKTVVHTVAMGPDSDQTLLLEIASQTGGTYNYIPNPATDQARLQGIYNTISAAVSNQQTLLAISDIIPVGATSGKQVVVDSTIGEATFSISWGSFSSEIELTLQDPSGNLIDPVVAASNNDITYVRGDNFVYYRIKSPTLISGVWDIIISGGIIPTGMNSNAMVNEGISYTLLVTGSPTGAAVTLNMYLDQASYDMGEPIKVSATLSDDQPITGAEIIAIVGPIITAGPPSQAQAAANNPILILYDDGMHGDGAANDGVYANTLEGSNTANAGVYDFLVFTSGTDNDGEAFSRVVRQSVNVGLDENSFRSNLVEFAHTIYLPAALRP